MSERRITDASGGDLRGSLFRHLARLPLSHLQSLSLRLSSCAFTCGTVNGATRMPAVRRTPVPARLFHHMAALSALTQLCVDLCNTVVSSVVINALARSMRHRGRVCRFTTVLIHAGRSSLERLALDLGSQRGGLLTHQALEPLARSCAACGPQLHTLLVDVIGPVQCDGRPSVTLLRAALGGGLRGLRNFRLSLSSVTIRTVAWLPRAHRATAFASNER